MAKGKLKKRIKSTAVTIGVIVLLLVLVVLFDTFFPSAEQKEIGVPANAEKQAVGTSDVSEEVPTAAEAVVEQPQEEASIEPQAGPETEPAEEGTLGTAEEPQNKVSTFK